MTEKTYDLSFKQQKFTDEQLKKEADRIISNYCPPDARPGENAEGYEHRKRLEALSNLAKNPQAVSRPSIFFRKIQD